MGKLHQDCKLGRPQTRGLERNIVKLRQPSRCLAQRRRVARTDAKSWLASGCHARVPWQVMWGICPYFARERRGVTLAHAETIAAMLGARFFRGPSHRTWPAP